MFKSFQDTSALQQFHGFPNLNMQQATSAYGFSGVTFWLDAAYGLNTQTNLGAVSSWQPRVGFETFTQSTAGNQPRLVLSDVNFNNLPSVDFFDNVRFIDFNQGISISSRNFTIIYVAKYDNINTNNVVIGNQTTGGNIGLGGTSSGINGCYASTNLAVQLNGTTESTASKIVCITNTELVVNGVQESTNVGYELDWSLNRIARSRSLTAQSLQGKISEIIVFANNKLSSTQLINISNNINQKYALY